MRRILQSIVLGAVTLVGLLAGARADDALPRRGYLGVAVYPLVAGNAQRLGLPDTLGVWVQMLPGDSPVAAAGLAVDDVIIDVNGRSIRGIEDFIDSVSGRIEGEQLSVRARRGRYVVRAEMRLPPVPLESAPGVVVEYSSFQVDEGVRLRAVVTRPDDADVAPRPGVVLYQDVLAPSVESGGFNPVRELSHALALAGWVVLRWERRGVGDSQGEHYAQLDRSAEREDAAAAWAWLASSGRCDGERIVLVGHGEGAVVAAELAASPPAGIPAPVGVISVAGRGRPWLTAARAAYHREQRALGLQGRDLDLRVEAWGRLQTLVAHGVDAATIAQRHPQWLRWELPVCDRPTGRTGAWLADALASSPASAWRGVRCPVLVLQGEADPSLNPAEAEAIMAALAEGGTVDRTLFWLEETDHMLAWASSPAVALRNWTTGEIYFQDAAAEAIVSWARALHSP